MIRQFWNTCAIPLVSGFTAFIAYAFAMRIGLLHPFWAPLTVLIIFQPTVGASFHLALQRLAGTFVGGIFAAALTNLGVGDSPDIIISLFTIIMAFFTLFACIGRLINGYAFQVAGYTTIVIYMISYRYDFAEASAVSVMRVVETFIGVSIGLFSLFWVRNHSEASSLREASQASIDTVRTWVRKVLQEGDSLEARRLLEDAITHLNSLNDLSSFASSERFFIGGLRKKTLYLMGNLYTILSITRALIRNDELDLPNPHRTEDDVPELKKIFEKLDRPAPHFSLSESPNWKGGFVSFLRVLVTGVLAGVIWQLTGWESGSTFFLISLIHVGMLATIHKPVQNYKDIIIALILSFFIVLPFMYFEGGTHFSIKTWAFLLLLLPGMFFVFVPKLGYLNIRLMTYSIVMYALCSRQASFSFEVLLNEYAAFLLALVFAVVMTVVFMPQTAKERYSLARRYLFYELRRVSQIRAPLDPKWMMTMYADIERMLFYAKEIQMDEPAILNEGLAVIDISVEILELRNLISNFPEDVRNHIAKKVAQITDLSKPVDDRAEGLLALVQKYGSTFDDRIAKTLQIIVKKIYENKSFFTQS